MSSSSSFQADGGQINQLDHAQIEQQRAPRPQARERVYYADWVRAMAIMLVIFVHCLVNSFDASGLEPELNPTI